jgi:NADH dehydrogenase
MMTAPNRAHCVVIVGAGFGGLETVFGLAGGPVEITLVDRRNHHLFQPLLYQVATASLATSEIAWPIRYLVRGRPEVTTLFANVNGVDAAQKRVLLDDGDPLPYDTLVLATDARHALFRPRRMAAVRARPEDAGRRHHAAAAHSGRVRARRTRDRPGAACGLADFRHHRRWTYRRRNDGHHRRPGQGHAGAGFSQHRHQQGPLVEAGPRVLAGFPGDLSAYAQRPLEEIGVEVVLGQPVTECSADGVVYGGSRLEARTIIWAAGVRASRAAEWLNAPADRAYRLQVKPDLTVPEHPDIFAVGDTVAIADANGNPVPGIAPAAKQQGRHVAWLIRARLNGGTLAPFKYKHAGSLAQIGKRKAVIDFGHIKPRGGTSCC